MSQMKKPPTDPIVLDEANPIAALIGAIAAVAVLALVLWFIFNTSDAAEQTAQALPAFIL